MSDAETYVVITVLGKDFVVPCGIDPLEDDIAIDFDESLQSMVLSVIPGTEEHGVLQIFYDNNINKFDNLKEKVRAAVFYPNQNEILFVGGIITSCIVLGESTIYRFVFSRCR